jgi:hypothetical protein
MRRVDSGCFVILTLAAAPLWPPAPAAAAIYNVGTAGAGGGCEASTLEAAIALAGATAANDEIRLDSDVLYQPADTISLINWSASTHGTLLVRGGYSSCTDTTADGAHAQIDLMLADPGIRIRTTTAGDAFVTLEKLSLIHSSGRALEVEWHSVVELFDVELAFNDGGGLAMSVGAEVYLDPATTVHHNGPTSSGGGIHCFNTGSVLESEAWVHHNTATDTGGGLEIFGCEAVLGASSRIEANEAGGDGGGIRAGSQALVSLFQGATVIGNEAGGWGGGIAAAGPEVNVLLIGAKVLLNRAGSGGGGLYAADEAYIGASGASCSGDFCPVLLDRNELLPPARNGSAAMAAASGIVQLKQTRVRGNIVPEAEAFGSVLFAATGGELRTESVEVWDNRGANRVFSVASGGSVRAAFTTAARNRYRDDANQLVEAFGLWATGTGSEARIFSSIFHPVAGYFVATGLTTQFDCLITESTFGLPASATETFVLDPGYANLETGDLRVGHGSPAVDFCDTLLYTPTVGGLDGRARGHDVPINPQALPGPWSDVSIQDLGAYEYWELFSDGFASGTMSAWSFAMP